MRASIGQPKLNDFADPESAKFGDFFKEVSYDQPLFGRVTEHTCGLRRDNLMHLLLIGK